MIFKFKSWKNYRELAEWFKAVSLSLIRLTKISHIRSNRIFSEECSLIGKIGSFNLQILGSSPSTLDFMAALQWAKTSSRRGGDKISSLVLYGLGPAWVGTSFGTRTSYVRIMIIRFLDFIEINIMEAQAHL